MMNEEQYRAEEKENALECDDLSAAQRKSPETEEQGWEDTKTEENKPEERYPEEKTRIRGRSRAKGGRRLSRGEAFSADLEAEADAVLKRVNYGTTEKDSEGELKRQGKFGKAPLVVAGVLAAAVLAVGGIYAGTAQRYKRVFFPNTQINGIEVSGLTVAEVKERISEGTDSYILRIEERGGAEEQISGESIGLHPEFNGALEQLMAAQNPYQWAFYQMGLRSGVHTLDAMIVYEEEELEKQLAELACVKPENQTEAENARISEYVPGVGYSVIPETKGTVVLYEALQTAVVEGLRNLQEQLSLDEAGVYKEAEITGENELLKAQVEAMNRYVGMTVTYRFGDRTEVLNGDRIHEWIVTDDAGNVTVDSGQVIRYVEELAAEYNTANKAKNLKTSYGKTIQVKGGSYGWKINQQAEADELAAILNSGESQTREPVYTQKAASHGENDYGDTYVEINLTAQHLFFYKEGKLVVESDFVSGNLSRGWGTPAGTYPLTYKQRDAVLKGENYRTPVDYWMPFNGGIGMHDATWRSSFGGTIYKTNGSHGCINLPHDVAKKIFENISAGVPVICYNLAGTEKGSSSVKPAESAAAPTQAPAATQAPEGTKAPDATQTPAVNPTQTPAVNPTQTPVETAESPTVKLTQPAAETKAPAETAESPVVTPTEPAAETPAPTQAPSGPGSDTGNSGGGSGPGAN